MKKRTALAALAAVAAAALVLPTSSVGAQDTVPVYVVHGINVAGETPVNVCVGEDEEPLLGGFEFTDFAGPLDLPVGAEVPISVYLIEDPEDVACGDGELVIEQTVTVPGGPVALVATGGPEGFQLTPFPIDLECTDAGNGRLSAFHASANTGEVEVQVGGAPVGSLEFGQDFSAEVPEGDYPVTVLLGETVVVGPDANIPVSEGVNTLAFVTGNFPSEPTSTPVVAIVEGVDIGVCDGPDPDPDPTPDPTPEVPTGPGTAPADPVAPGERPLALTG